jgi:hypothetical protein
MNCLSTSQLDVMTAIIDWYLAWATLSRIHKEEIEWEPCGRIEERGGQAKTKLDHSLSSSFLFRLS